MWCPRQKEKAEKIHCTAKRGVVWLIMNYIEKWKWEIEKIPPKEYRFTSFVLSLMLIPLTVRGANEIGKPTNVKSLTNLLKQFDADITQNIVDCSIRHYRTKNRLVRRKCNLYMRPFQYILTNKGYERLEWLKNEKYLN